LYWYDYLDREEIKQILKGEQLVKPKVRDWNKENSIVDDFANKLFELIAGQV